jgi:pyrrolysyl-tRNA synthetase-like protein
MDIPWSPVQRRRLEELGLADLPRKTDLPGATGLADATGLPRAAGSPQAAGGPRGEAGRPPAVGLDSRFAGEAARDTAFQELEAQLVRERRSELAWLQGQARPPALWHMEQRIAGALAEAGFTRVLTPTLMTRGMLAKMGIRAGHPLHEKVFWVDARHCLRPMLAPHLYSLLVDLLRVWEKPIRIFEAGSCFRRETQGSQHAAEFTMLNLCEMGLPAERCCPRLEELASRVMRAAGIEGFTLQAEDSVVYGQTIDLVARGVEVGSAALGPHELDRPWKITDPWVGIGLGLERLVMVAEGGESLAPWGRSLTRLDGLPLRV